MWAEIQEPNISTHDFLTITALCAEHKKNNNIISNEVIDYIPTRGMNCWVRD